MNGKTQIAKKPNFARTRLLKRGKIKIQFVQGVSFNFILCFTFFLFLLAGWLVVYISKVFELIESEICNLYFALNE